jgi:signal transduction histidine kinase/CheY-like chemotaxis protein
MSSTPDSKPPKSTGVASDQKQPGSGVWRFALEGGDADLPSDASEASWLGRVHHGKAQVSLYLTADGVLLAPPVGKPEIVGLGPEAEPGMLLGKLLDKSLAEKLIAHAHACITLHVEMLGTIDAEVGGASKRLQVSLSPGHIHDEPRGCMATVRDVSNASGAARADPWTWQSTVALASGIAHRFNNLLVAVTGNVGLLKTALPADHPEQAAIADMEQAARDMAAMTRYLLAFAGEGRYAARPVSVNELAARALAAVNPGLYPHVQFTQDFDAHLPPIEADPGQIEQAIFNLVLNAVEALPLSGGTVCVCTETVTSESSIRIIVKDDGSGIPDAVRSRMFEPFFTTRAPGRGLGLPAVLGIARGHRGSVRVRSADGRGTEVEIQLPFSGHASHAPASKRRRAKTPERKVVLVVDDDPGTVRVLERALVAQGFATIAVGTGEAALKAAAARKADLALCIVDMGLPDTSGDRLCGELKKLVPTVPIVVCSGYADQRSADQTVEAGADGFLGKPFDREELAAAIRKAMGS